MPQTFPPAANTLSRLGLAALLLSPIGLLTLGAEFNGSSYISQVGQPLDQPVPFSHQHHVAELGLDCRYCHTTVERSEFANVPPTKTCMTCHSQVWKDAPVLEPVRESYRTGQPIRWNRVHDMPDFVYFNHSIHVQKGIGCVSCHGRVDQMPLTWKVHHMTMAWCLECHRHPERYVRPRAEIFAMNWQPENQKISGPRLVHQYKIQRKTTCSTCHR